MSSATALTISAPDSNAAAAALRLRSFEVPVPSADEVLVEFLAAPVNPLDLMVVADKYPIKPRHHVAGEPVPGYDGVARVMSVGGNAGDTLRENDLVVPRGFGLGTWRTHAVFAPSELLRIGSDNLRNPETHEGIDIRAAAVLKMTFLPAYFLIEDSEAVLQTGDYIIQNAGASAVGQMVVQFAKMRGLRTISVVRDGDSGRVERLKQGPGAADIVLAESEIPATTDQLRSKSIMLALDPVFGSAGQNLLSVLSRSGTYLNFGFLSRIGATVEPKLAIDEKMIFWNNVLFRSFRLSESLAKRTDAQIEALIGWFVQLLREQKLVFPDLEIVPWVWGSDTNEHEDYLRGVVGKMRNRQLGERKKVFIFPAALDR